MLACEEVVLGKTLHTATARASPPRLFQSHSVLVVVVVVPFVDLNKDRSRVVQAIDRLPSVTRAATLEKSPHLFLSFLSTRHSVLVIVLVQVLHHVIDELLVVFHIPDTVTGEKDELCLLINRRHFDFWEDCNHLLLGVQTLLALVFEVTKGA